MPAQIIQAFPPGLLSFFGIKNGGSNPNLLTEQLAATVELRDWYLAQQVTLQTTLIADVGAVIGTNSLAFTVPQNQIWWAQDVTIITPGATAAGNSGTFGVVCTDPNGPQVLIVQPFTVAATKAGASSARGPFLFRPGQTINVFPFDVVHGAAFPMRVTMGVVPMTL